MGRRRREDAIDVACGAWARQRRVLVGLDEPRLAREYVGSLSCTLDRIRRLADGASGSGGRVQQRWPEVYVGEAVWVNAAYKRMRPELRRVMDAHYVARGSIDDKAEAVAMSRRSYFERLREVRSFVEGFLARESVA